MNSNNYFTIKFKGEPSIPAETFVAEKCPVPSLVGAIMVSCGVIQGHL